MEAIEYCHRRSVAHRDIKLDNIIVSQGNRIKLIDFGFATDEDSKMFCGTPCYMAPEIVSRKEVDGVLADLWACGVVLYAMACGSFPFFGAN